MIRNNLLVSGVMACLCAMAAFGPARAAANLVTNGDFETSSETVSDEVNAAGITSAGATLTGWTNTGYAYVFTPGTADTTGATNREFGGSFNLWGPGDGSANGLTATSPTGGNFFASDGAFQTGTLSQTITGLVVGYSYQLTFYWATAQQNQNTGATTENWTASFGSSSYTTSTANTASKGFDPWMRETVSFRATSTSQLLSFMAAGTPSGTPPMALLDGISLVAAPEPSAAAMLLAGLVGMGLPRLGRRKAAVAG